MERRKQGPRLIVEELTADRRGNLRRCSVARALAKKTSAPHGWIAGAQGIEVRVFPDPRPIASTFAARVLFDDL